MATIRDGAAAGPPDEVTDPPALRLGPYLLTGRLASGGMGAVWVALRRGAGADPKPLAVKVLLAPLESNTGAVERFTTEGQLGALMRHPNVVEVMNSGVDGGRHYLAMELLHAVSLSRLSSAAQQAGQRFDAEVLVHLARALAAALAHAHGVLRPDGQRLGLVHRDVTPHNLLVTVDGAVKLADFGIATTASGAAGRADPLQGKLDYVAPEQLDGAAADALSDVYSAGVTLFTLAARRTPFGRETSAATSRAIRAEAPPDLSTLRPDLPRALVLTLERAMARRPADRFPSAQALLAALPEARPATAATLGTMVQTLCRADLAVIAAAVSEAGTIAERSELMMPTGKTVEQPPAPTPSWEKPRGTLELTRAQPSRRPEWVVPLVVAVLALAALAAAVLFGRLLTTG